MVKTNNKDKYLVTIEFRYSEEIYEVYHAYGVVKEPYTKSITLGVFGDFEDACKEGNTAMEKLEEMFPLYVFPDGREAKRERFSINGGALGGRSYLITNLAYLETPFAFYAKIGKLNYDALDDTVNEILNTLNRGGYEETY